MGSLCVKCKGTKLLCGRPKCPLLEKARLSPRWTPSTKLEAPTPPSVFVGRIGYPNIFAGPLVARHDNPEILDSPETWYGLPLDEVVKYRASLFRGKEKFSVQSARNPPRHLEEMQLGVMSKKSVDIDISLKKPPKVETFFSEAEATYGSSGEISGIKLASNPVIPRVVDEVTSDEVKAGDALFHLYEKGIPVSKLSNMLSIGVLGIKRKLVPTRWSITAVDDSVGKELIAKVKEFPEVSNYMVFESFYLGNRFEVLLAPGRWMFENVEIYDPGCIWVTGGERPVYVRDWEPFKGRKAYASQVEGAYYAARLAALERLAREKRQASVLVVREITSEYWMPVGVWQIRENVRAAMRSKPTVFDSLEESIRAINSRLNVKNEWVNKSELISRLRSRDIWKRWVNV